MNYYKIISDLFVLAPWLVAYINLSDTLRDTSGEDYTHKWYHISNHKIYVIKKFTKSRRIGVLIFSWSMTCLSFETEVWWAGRFSVYSVTHRQSSTVGFTTPSGFLLEISWKSILLSLVDFWLQSSTNLLNWNRCWVGCEVINSSVILVF